MLRVERYLFFFPYRSAIGKWPEAQKVTLSPRCQDLGSILHELTHLLGFEHEHNHPKRDDYVDVHESNIEASMLWKLFPSEYCRCTDLFDLTSCGFAEINFPTL